jgi:hypothetical protein
MQTRFAGGLLTAARTAEDLEAAPKARSLYDQVAGAKLSGTARIFLDADALLGIYGGMLKAGIAQLSGYFGQLGGLSGQDPETLKTTGKMVKLELLALIALLEPSDSLQLDLDWGEKGFDIDGVLAARPGTDLEAFFTKSAAVRAPLRSSVEGGNALAVGSVAVDPPAFDALLGRVLKDLAVDPDAASLLTPEIVTVFTSPPMSGRALASSGWLRPKLASSLFTTMRK